MSALGLINETTASSVASVEITDVFNADFDIYQITFNNLVQATSTATFSYLRFLNSSGSEISSSSYDYALLVTRAGGSFQESRATNQSTLWHSIYNCVNESDFGGANMYIFNPYSNSSYTFIINQSFFRYDGTSGGTVGHEGYKQISVLKTTDRIEGIKFYNSTGNFANFDCKIYGLRVDS